MRFSSIQATRVSQHVPRKLRSQSADIVPNSLRDTLEAHRSSNRARLIRRVIPRSPAPGLFRPDLRPENWAGYKPPVPATPLPSPSEPQRPGSKRRVRSRLREASTRQLNKRSLPANLIKLGNSSDHARPVQSPWLSHLQPLLLGDASVHLDAELKALARYLAPSPDEQEQLNRLDGEIGSLLKGVVPHRPQLIGSHRTGLALAHSNISLLLRYHDESRSLDNSRRPSPTRPQIKQAHLNLLDQVESALLSSELFGSQMSRPGKRKPFLEILHRPTGLLLHLRCGEGIPAITEYLQDYLIEYPALKPLYIASRTLLEAHGLFGSSQKGIEPDALALLVVVFLKTTHGRFPGPNRLGDQFLGLLQLYGTEVNLTTTGVAVDPPGFFGAESIHASASNDKGVTPAHIRGQRSLMNVKSNAAAKGNIPEGQRLCIQDPSHYMNNLGRSCVRTLEMQSVFASAHERLSQALADWHSQSQNHSILRDGLQANFDGLKGFRRRIVASASS